jgi:hypothetical protein
MPGWLSKLGVPLGSEVPGGAAGYRYRCGEAHHSQNADKVLPPIAH